MNVGLFFSGTIDAVPKYIYLLTGIIIPPSTTSDLIATYPAGFKETTEIDSQVGVGTPGMVSLNIYYGNKNTFASDTINVDTTSSASFWTDVIGWLQMNNFFGATSDGIGYTVDDKRNATYVMINYNAPL